MKTYAICPISDKRINERVARFNGLFTVLLISIFFLKPNLLVIGFLAIDFYFRANDLTKFSLIALLSKNTLKFLPISECPINAGPKIFAARIGLLFSISALFSLLLGFETTALVLAGVLGLFSFLEAAFGLCVACEIYPFVYKFLYQSNFDRSKK